MARFQDLPRCARDTIYRELFLKPKAVSIPEDIKKARSARAVATSTCGLGLLRTNKRIHRECLEILYGENRFIVEAPGLKPERISNFKKFLKTVGPRARGNIKYLSLRFLSSRLKKGIVTKSRGQTLSQFNECLSLLNQAWLEILELSLDEDLSKEIENSLSVLKITELAIRASPQFSPPKEVLKNVWGTRLIMLGNINKETRGPNIGATLHPRQVHAYRSLFAQEALEIKMEYERSAADSKDHFSALPQEIREHIYQHLLIAEEEVCPLPSYRQHEYCWANDRVQYNKPSFEGHMTIALLRTSRQLHCESSPILYGQNIFNLRSCEENSITKWLLSIGEHNRGNLKFLRLDHDELLQNSEVEVPHLSMPPMIGMHTSPMGLTFAKQIRDAHEAMGKQMKKHLSELTKTVAADFTSTLELLIETANLSRLEINIPSHYYFIDDDDLPTARLVQAEPCHGLTQQTIDSLPKMRISNELRLGINALSVDLAKALEKMRLARVVLTNTNVRDWMDTEHTEIEIDGKLLEVESGWHFTQGPAELSRSFRPFENTKLEKRIGKMWPQPEELFQFCAIACPLHEWD